MKYCKSCGLLMADEATVCPSCGAAAVPEHSDTTVLQQTDEVPAAPESDSTPTFAADTPAVPENDGVAASNPAPAVESGTFPLFTGEAPAAPEPPIEPAHESNPQPGPAPASPAGQGPVYSRGYESGNGAAYTAPNAAPGGYAQNASYAPNNGYIPNNAPNNGYYAMPGVFSGSHVPQEQTLTTGGYLFALIIFMIPFVGFIMELVWSFGGSENLARQSLARAYLIRSVIIAALSILFFIVICILIAAVAGSNYYY